MRTILPLPLTFLVAASAGCGSGATQQAMHSVPKRDLTLAASTAPILEVASPVEVQRVPVQRRTVRTPERIARPAPVERADAAAPAMEAVVAVPEPVAEPTSVTSTAQNDRELPPGKTITVIPASSGPSVGSDDTDEIPEAQGRPMVVRGGGTCRGRGRGPGIGIAAAPRPDFR
jgi:hypothetical protein